MGKNVRHILGLSGGKDSAALAVYLHRKVPQMEYFFCDTHKELPETYEFLNRLKARLGIKITYLSAERGFDHWLAIFNGFLPSPGMRWCTKELKIRPLEKFVGNDEAISYIAIRSDESRDGYIAPINSKIKPVYPFKEDGLTYEGVVQLLEDKGVGIPSYYKWRSRSGCYFCFFQKKYEWVMLAELHPELFREAVKYEQEHSDGRKFFWNEDESLIDIINRKDEIIANHKRMESQRKKKEKGEYLIDILDDEADYDDVPCLMCHK